MGTGELIALITIAVGILTLMSAFVRAIYKIAHVVDTMETLARVVSTLSERVNTLDQRMYEYAVRGTTKR